MSLLNILSESGLSKSQQDIVQHREKLKQAAVDYAQQIEANIKWCDYLVELMPQLEAVAAKFSTTPFEHKNGVSFYVDGHKTLSEINRGDVEAACAPFKVKFEAGYGGAALATFVLDKKPKPPKAKL